MHGLEGGVCLSVRERGTFLLGRMHLEEVVHVANQAISEQAVPTKDAIALRMRLSVHHANLSPTTQNDPFSA